MSQVVIKTVPASAQTGSFGNSTQQSLGDNLCLSIAVYIPDHLQGQDEEFVRAALRSDFQPLADIGYDVEIQIGLDDEQ